MATVENLPIPGIPEFQDATLRDTQRTESIRAISVALQALAGSSGDAKIDRFERVLIACVTGRVATSVEGFLSFARELCDGIDREAQPPITTP